MFKILRSFLVAATLIQITPTIALEQHGGDSPLPACLAISDQNTRLSCIKALIYPNDAATTRSFSDSWPLSRSQDPLSKRTIVSIARSADPLKSDIDLAGLIIRCASANSFEILIALVKPIPIRSRTTVMIESALAPMRFEALSVLPGSLLQLPQEAVESLKLWENLVDLNIAIETSPTTNINGKIPLSGLARALPQLAGSCGAL